jgi:hypothetical protein
MASTLSCITNDLWQHEILNKFWRVPSERYVVYSLGLVNHACHALVLHLFKTWNAGEDLNSWTLFRTLVKGRNYELLKDVFCSFYASPREVLHALGASASPFTLQFYRKMRFQFRPFAYFRLDWQELQVRALKRLPELLDVVVQPDDQDVLGEFSHAFPGMQNDILLESLVRGNHPRLFQQFLNGSVQASSDARQAILHCEHPEMWEVALSKIPQTEAFWYACQQSRFQVLTLLCAKARNCEHVELVAMSLQMEDVDVFIHVWDCFDNEWQLFLKAWQTVDFMDLPPVIFKKVVERFDSLEGLNLSVARSLMGSIRYVPLVEHLPTRLVKTLVYLVVQWENHDYFDALVNADRENITRCLFDKVIECGNVSMFLRAQDKFGKYECTRSHVLDTLISGKVEIMASLLSRYPLDEDIFRFAREILEHADQSEVEIMNTARFVLADPRCVNLS